ncbi:MAG: lipocalin family protein [Proteobacteria bacterium]|nr:lipocalin family protein [Pseudomonadota bacterium]MBU1737917.1 lipocalin family protein [Pseudomonadota bacterium]
MRVVCVFILLMVSLLTACIPMKDTSIEPLQTVEKVDLERYLGEWYEIARYPNRFQQDCPASKATYSLLPSGKIEVLNECYDHDYQHVLRSVKGKARIVDQSTNARLKVTFFWPFSGDYWIIDLGDNYEYAVVGHPDRKYLWILSRTPEMSEDLYGKISEGLISQGYDPARLVRR